MRFSTFVSDRVVPCIYEGIDVHETLRKFNGGWEIWAQVQIAIFMARKEGYSFTFEREVHFRGGSGPKCDFRIVGNYGGHYKIWSELKVELLGDEGELVKRFKADIEKLDDHKDDFDGGVGGAIAIALDGGNFVAKLKKNVKVHDRSPFICYQFPKTYVSGTGPTRFHLDAEHEVPRNYAVIAVRPVFDHA